MTKNEFIRAVAELIADLQVPISLHDMGLAKAQEPWTKLHQSLVGFGWSNAEDIERLIHERVSWEGESS